MNSINMLQLAKAGWMAFQLGLRGFTTTFQAPKYTQHEGGITFAVITHPDHPGDEGYLGIEVGKEEKVALFMSAEHTEGLDRIEAAFAEVAEGFPGMFQDGGN